ncbi:MAG: hypothetical protein MR270_02900 [Erysipelotrichaceae bacterium]|nr:hypothetical protein [Erysipelotrichaceae bacterium]
MNKKTKKVLRIVGDCVFALFMVFICFFAISNVRARKNNNIPNLFGNGYLTVDSNSMDGDRDDSFKVGDLITVKVLKNGSKDLQVNQIITYYDVTERKVITHRIVEVVPIDGTEYVYYRVKGDATLDVSASYYEVRNDEVLAVYKGKVAGLGKVVKWFQAPVGFFLIVVLPCIIFFVVELVQFIKTYAEVKAEKNSAKSEEEKAKEREELKKQLLEELKAEQKKLEEENKQEEVKEEDNKNE